MKIYRYNIGLNIMICLRSGYCCINYDVMIVDDPKLGIVENNIIHKPHGEKCKHLGGEKFGEYFCKVHNEPWYCKTPCYDYSQIENGNMNCRIGEYILKETQK